MTGAEPLLARLAALIEEIEAEKFQILHDTGLMTVDEELVQVVVALLGETTRFLEEVQSHYGGDDDLERHTPPNVSPEEAARGLAAEELADLAFVSRNEMIGLTESLEGAFRAGEIWQVLSCADTGLGRSERALIVLESAIREYEGLPRVARLFFDLEDSLAIRHQYALLRSALRRLGTPQGVALLHALADVASHIAMLRSLQIYVHMWINDRRQIRGLQKRILAALATPDADQEEARQVLWQDLLSCTHLLMQVNNRHELREHDYRVVLEGRGALAGYKHHAPVPRAVLETLQLLLGRDPDLDELLLAEATPQVGAVCEILERLRVELRGSRPT